MTCRLTVLRSALAALLVVLAGCGSLTQPPETPHRTVTPVSVPTDSPTQALERAEVPAPLTGGALDATDLARRHAESLSRRSYLLDTYVSRSWGTGPSRSVQNRLDRRSYRVQSDGTYRAARVLLVVGSGPASRLPRWAAYADGEAEYRRIVDDDGTTYERRSLAPAALPPHQGRAVAMIVRYLDVAEARIEHVRPERGPRLRVVGRDPQAAGLRNVSAYRVEAVLTGSGRVLRLEATYIAPNRTTVRAGFRVRDVGSVRVAPPDWYGDARAETLEPAVRTDTSEGRSGGTATPTPRARTPDSGATPTPTSLGARAARCHRQRGTIRAPRRSESRFDRSASRGADRFDSRVASARGSLRSPLAVRDAPRGRVPRARTLTLSRSPVCRPRCTHVPHVDVRTSTIPVTNIIAATPARTPNRRSFSDILDVGAGRAKG